MGPRTNNPATVAAQLRRVADALDALDTLPAEVHLTLAFQPSGDEADEVATIDTLGRALLDKAGGREAMLSKTVHHNVEGDLGPVRVQAYTSVAATPEEWVALRLAEDTARHAGYGCTPNKCRVPSYGPCPIAAAPPQGV